MKKIFWTTIFWFVVIAGLAFYTKMYNPTLGSQVCTWLGASTSSGVVVSQDDSLTTIQATLTDMQTKLDQLLQGTSVQQPTLPTTSGTGN